MLSSKSKIFLLSLARQTIAQRCAGRPAPRADNANAELAVQCGVFVTLHDTDGELRGCIGYVEGVKPLAQSVIDMALSEAFRDPRFSPVTERELKNIVIEITVLSPLTPIQSTDAVVVGKHGLVATKGHNRGLLLPQVPVEHHWDRDTFLSHTCMKAGLKPDEWRKGAVQFEVFEGEVFNEKDLT